MSLLMAWTLVWLCVCVTGHLPWVLSRACGVLLAASAYSATSKGFCKSCHGVRWPTYYMYTRRSQSLPPITLHCRDGAVYAPARTLDLTPTPISLKLLALAFLSCECGIQFPLSTSSVSCQHRCSNSLSRVFCYRTVNPEWCRVI